MRRNVVALLGIIFLLSYAQALSLSVKTLPGVVTPGTSGKLIFEVTATNGARNMEMVVEKTSPFDIEDAGNRVDLGDVMGGTVSYVLWFSVPSTAEPGVYVIPVTITYTDPSTGKSYEEHFAPIITVTSGKGISIKMPDKVYGDVKQKINIALRNTGAKIYSATLFVPDAVGENRIYLGDLDSGEEIEKYVEILPRCENGLYRAEFTLEGYQGTQKISENLSYTSICIPQPADLRVFMYIPEKIEGGEQNTTLVVSNGTSTAIGPVTISIAGVNVRIGGKTSYYYNSIAPGERIEIPVIWKLEKSDEPGTINVTITTGDGQRMYSFSVLPEDEPKIDVYVADVPEWEGDKIKVTIAVANVGTGTAENVFIETNSPLAFAGKELIGDLGPGDYDTATVYLTNPGREEKIHVKVTYTAYGEKKTVEEDVIVSVPERPKAATAWIALALLVAAGVWWWRKHK